VSETLPDLVIRHGRDRGGRAVAVSREEIAASSFDGLPALAIPGPGRARGDSGLPLGELPGVRSTMDETIAQEVAGGCDPAVAAAQVQRIAASYDRDVQSGRDPYPLRRD
jgi:hypothetical protein